MRANPRAPLQAVSPPISAEQVRSELKRAGIKGNVEALVLMYGWHDGAVPKADSEAAKKGIAPPVVRELPKAHIEYLEGLGVKVDPGKKVYNSFLFFRFESAVRWIKLHKKFAN